MFLNKMDWFHFSYDIHGNVKTMVQELFPFGDAAVGEAYFAQIEWTVYGKIKKITRATTSTKPDLEFAYDAGGNRVAKIVKDKSGEINTTYYLRDATGNVMAVYAQRNTQPMKLNENHIYGSSRLGISRPNVNNQIVANGNEISNTITLGDKDYELTDHLGNVRAVVSDAVDGGGNVTVTGAFDYYPFGMKMMGRVANLQTAEDNKTGYRYGYNGKEQDFSMKNIDGADYDYGARIYDARVARFFRVRSIIT